MMFNAEITIGHTPIALDQPSYFVADIAANHDGDLDRARELIFLAAQSGANAAKFQHFSAETIVSDTGFKALGDQLSHQGSWEKSVYETYQDASINRHWNAVLKQTCAEANIDYFTSPYSIELVDEVDPFVAAYKIGSGDITFSDIIAHIANKQKPVLLATGASTMDDVNRAVSLIAQYNRDLVLMQCNTNYTGSSDNFRFINLHVIDTFRKAYPGVILGLSDHTPGDTTVLGAIAFGARVIEKHFTDDNSRKGPDHGFSMNPQSWRTMVDRSRELEAALGNGAKTIEHNERETVVLQRRCLRLACDLPKGTVLTADHLVALRPAPTDSLPPYRWREMIGQQLVCDKSAGDALHWSDVTELTLC